MRKNSENGRKRFGHLSFLGNSSLLLGVVRLFLIVASVAGGDVDDVCGENGECVAQEPSGRRVTYWTADQYPRLFPQDKNQEGGYTCHFRNAPPQAVPRICDPDGVLTDGLLSDSDASDSYEAFSDVWSVIHQLEIIHSNVTTTLGCTVGGENDEGKNADKAQKWGVQMAVALVKKMDLSRYSHEHSEDPVTDAARDFAVALHNDWGVGESIPNCGDSGILLFLSVYDRAMYISTGSAIRKVLTPDRLGVVLDAMKRFLQRGQYDGAIQVAVLQIHEYLEKGPPSWKENLVHHLSEYGFGVVIFLVAFLHTVFQWRRGQRDARQYAQVRSELSRLDRDRALALQGRYRCKSCPICLADFQTPGAPAQTEAALDGPQLEEEEDDRSTAAAASSVGDPAPSESAPLVPAENESSREGANNEENSDNLTPPASPDDQEEPLPTHGSDGLPLKLLRCGHVFDQTCWEEWVREGAGNVAKCPICQQDVGGNNNTNNAAAGAPPVNINQDMAVQERNRDDDDNNNDPARRRMALFERERNFRLVRLARHYPRWVRPDQVARWTHHTYNGQLTRDPQFIQRDPSRVGASSSSSSSSFGGSRGGGGGFGGGRSGGGAGGRW